ncbi:MAG: hypothetical protein AAFV33_16780 [Chloroflexota bacterium]
MALNTNQLDTLRGAFASHQGQHGKLSDYIMELQGTGNDGINKIVNDLVFLRRELMSSYPNRTVVQQLLARVYKRAAQAAKEAPAFDSTLKGLCNTIASIK